MSHVKILCHFSFSFFLFFLSFLLPLFERVIARLQWNDRQAFTAGNLFELFVEMLPRRMYHPLCSTRELNWNFVFNSFTIVFTDVYDNCTLHVFVKRGSVFISFDFFFFFKYVYTHTWCEHIAVNNLSNLSSQCFL